MDRTQKKIQFTVEIEAIYKVFVFDKLISDISMHQLTVQTEHEWTIIPFIQLMDVSVFSYHVFMQIGVDCE